MNRGRRFRNRLDQSGDLVDKNEDPLCYIDANTRSRHQLVFETPGAWGRKGDESGALITKQR
jgi:hypothetical protein